MKKIIFGLLMFVFTLTIFGCNKSKKADIVTTLFPQYDIAKAIAKDRLSVAIITPFGSEVHDYSPTPKDVVAIKESKLFLYTSDAFDVWVEGLKNSNINMINLKDYITLETTDLSTKMHYWTDPFVFIEMIDVIKTEIIKIDPHNSSFYENNALDYKNEILDIHNLLSSFLENKDKKVIYFAGHNALGGFASRYNLSIVALIDDYKPDADQTIKDMEHLKNALINSNSHYLFIEELTEPKVAKTIQNELKNLGIDIVLLELHGYHNITKKQSKEGINYASLFRQNYENIKKSYN